MAGEGWRQFTREVLMPEDVQGYLQDQAVMRFSSASQRSSELTVPTAGMVSYLQDVDEFYGRTPSSAGGDTGGVWRGFARHWGTRTGSLPTAASSNPAAAQPGDTVYSSALGSVLVVSSGYEWRQVGVRRVATIATRNQLITDALAAGIGGIPDGFLVYVTGNNRLYARDTGGTWRLLGGRAGTALTLTTGTGAPQTGWTGAGYTGTLRHNGAGLATVQFDIVRSGANITPSTTGAVTNSNLLQLPAGWEAAGPAYIGTGPNGNRAVHGYIPASNRTIQLTNVAGTADVATGATLSFAGTYPLLTPGDLDD